MQYHDILTHSTKPTTTLYGGTLQGAHNLQATITKWNDRGSKHYITLNINQINDRPTKPFNARLRLYDSQIPANLQLGDEISVFGKIATPKPAQVENGFSARQFFWMQNIHYSGFALANAEIIKPYQGEWLGFKNIKNFIHFKTFKWRNKIAANIRSSIDGNKGEVATALLTGLRGKISTENQENMRFSGLAHLLAISGLHMGCAALSVFFLTRLLLSLHSPWALGKPIKKIAALTAIATAFIYLLLAGGSISVERAWMMTTLALIAVLIDRRIFNLRIVAITAFLILLWQPRQIASVGFQLSFLAVIALTAFFEWKNKTHKHKSESENLIIRSLVRLSKPLKAAALTTLIAGFATTPAISHYFGYVAPWSLAANMLAVPLTAFIIIPSGFIALALMPIGLHDIPLHIMGQGIELLLEIASFFRHLPAGEWHPAHFNAVAYACFAAGFLFLCLWRGKLRFASLILCAFAYLLWNTADKPNIIIQSGKEIFAVKMQDNAYGLYSKRKSHYIAKKWQDHYGLGDFTKLDENIQTDNIKCDEFHCRIGTDFKIILSYNKNHLHRHCAEADYVITYFDRGDFRPCYELQTPFITHSQFKEKGAMFVYGRKIKFAASQKNRLWQKPASSLLHKNLVNK